MTERCFVACTPGLEAPLAEELVALGVEPSAAAGGCEVTGPKGSFVRLNVQSRVASRVWLRLGVARTPAALAGIPVRHVVGDVPLALAVTVAGRVSPPPAVWRREAMQRWRLRPSPGRTNRGEGPDARAAGSPVELSLRLDGSGAEVSVDTSGALLHVRGARQETGRAPLRETLAAGLLRLSRWTPGEPLWDVMCGSGTILLEAAEQSLGLQPGRQRSFAFERFPGGWRDLRLEVERAQPAVRTWLRGSDLNAGALGVARRNARRAGVLEAISLERLDATALERPEVPPGLVVANLPYGKRVGESSAMAGLYAQLGRSLRQTLGGWRFALLVERGAPPLGLTVERTHALKNGGLSCLVLTGRL